MIWKFDVVTPGDKYFCETDLNQYAADMDQRNVGREKIVRQLGRAWVSKLRERNYRLTLAVAPDPLRQIR